LYVHIATDYILLQKKQPDRGRTGLETLIQFLYFVGNGAPQAERQVL
jgi:hypothetical protein